jgi:phytoene dehydrogenase-like protein
MDGRGKMYDTVVVGGGMAGLTAAAFVADAGHSVALCEKGPVTGGLVNSFERNGFTWDAGIRAFEDSGIILPMLKSLGIDLPLARSPVSIGIEDRVIPVESPANLADYEELLVGLYPDSREEIGRIVQNVRLVMKHMDVLYGVENPIFKDVLRDRDYLFKVLLPWLGRFLITIGKINRMNAPVEDHLRSFTSNQALIDIISQHFFRKTPAFFAMSYFSLYLDYCYPAGGTGVLPRRMEAFCTDNGVDILTDTRIVAVDPQQRTVTDADGRSLGYRTLVWAADLKALYGSVGLIGEARHTHVPREARRKAAAVAGSRGGDSVFTLYLAVDTDPTWFAAKSNGHLFYTASRHGVGASLQDELQALLSLAPSSQADVSSDVDAFMVRARAWLEHYLASTTLEISIPVLKDPTLAPVGKTGLIVSVLFDFDLCDAIRAKGRYEELKRFVEDRLIDALEGSIYPGIRDSIIDRFSYTPCSIERIIGSTDGAITGWAFTNPVVPAINRMQAVSSSVRTGLPGIYQAGQWAFSPSGLPIAILTGKLAAQRVNRDLKRRRT